MKKFVLKLILFSGLIFGSLILLNFLYVRTEAYKTMNDMEKFYNVPDNLEIVNFGSSHGLYAFDYSELYLKGFNFALNSQDLFYDFQLLKQYQNHMVRGTTIVIISVSFFSLSVDPANAYLKERDKRYYRILDTGLFEGSSPDDFLKFKLLPVLSAGSTLIRIFQDKPSDTFLELSTNRFDYVELEGEAQETAVRHLSYIEMNGLDRGISLLKEIIVFCQQLELKPVLITTPFTEYYTKYFSENILDEFHRVVYSIANEFSIPYFDYSRDPYFWKRPELFIDDDHLNSIGRGIFTRMVVDTLKKTGLLY